MMNHATTEVFFDDVVIPADALIGDEGNGLPPHPRRHERRADPDRSRVHRRRPVLPRAGQRYANEREVFGRPIGVEPGRAVPARAGLRQPRGRRSHALEGGGAVRRAASPAAPRPTWPRCSPPTRPGQAGNAALDTHGGFGFAAEYDIERKFRETRLYQVAPINNNLILAFVGAEVPRPAQELLRSSPMRAVVLTATEHTARGRRRPSRADRRPAAS